LANSDRPTTDPKPASATAVDSRVNTEATTPAEGCTPRKRQSVSPAPNAPASFDFTATRPDTDQQHQTGVSDPSGRIDLTPAPVVIGIKASGRVEPKDRQASTSDPQLERRVRAARNTPAEPVASVRVRERAAERASISGEEAPRSRAGDSVCDDRVVTMTDLRPPAQYFPPMRPPESAPGHVATQPKVHIVPDCDTRQRTARSLRRLSTTPPATTHRIGLVHGWALYVIVAALACAGAIALVRGLSALGVGSKHHSGTRESSSSATPASPKLAPLPEPRRAKADAGSSLTAPATSAQGSRKSVSDSSAPKANATRLAPSAVVPATNDTVF
jgi:hypothetical protein